MKVKVYSTSWCPYCHALMEWLDSLDIKYEIIDAEALLDDDNSEINSVPATEINDNLIFGFDRPAITNALKSAKLLARSDNNKDAQSNNAKKPHFLRKGTKK